MNARPRARAITTTTATAAALALWVAAAATPLRTLHAQAATGDATPDSAAAVAAVAAPLPQSAPALVGPTMSSASIAVRAVGSPTEASSTGAAELTRRPEAAGSAAPTNALPAARNSQGQPKALMIVGGAAFIAGALIGDTAGTAIMIGGAGVGLYGLYLYLQ